MQKVIRNVLMLATLPVAINMAFAAPAAKAAPPAAAPAAAPATPTLSAEDKAAAGKT